MSIPHHLITNPPHLPFRNRISPVRRPRQKQQLLLNLRREVQKVHNLGDPGTGNQHRKALDDIHALINSHGQNGVWLWDPYLSANDVLDTLFYCRYANADLRALTAALEAPSDSTTGINATGPSNKATFIEDQRKILNATKSNFQGIKIEYRAKVGQAGWGFHDRFLIFPETENGPLAWSLGTSVNSFGKQHHILQRADDGGLVKDAFVDLWEQLDQPEHLIWKKP